MAVVTQWSPATEALQAWDAFCKPFPTESWYDCGFIVLVAWDFDGAWYCPWLKPGYFILILKKTDDFLGSCVEKREPCGMVKIYHPLHSYPCCDFLGSAHFSVKLQIRKGFTKSTTWRELKWCSPGIIIWHHQPQTMHLYEGKSIKKCYHRICMKFDWSLPNIGVPMKWPL